MADDLPEWALDKAATLFGEASRIQDRADDYRKLPETRAFAEYIAAHEHPPVDPLLLEARKLAAEYLAPVDPFIQIRMTAAGAGQGYSKSEALARIRDGRADDTDMILGRLAALKRGMELTASDASASVQSPGCVDAAPGRKG